MLSRFADIPGSESRGRDLGRDNLGHNKDKKRGFRVQAQSKRNGPSRLHTLHRDSRLHVPVQNLVYRHIVITPSKWGDSILGWGSMSPFGHHNRQHHLLRTTQAHHIFCICSEPHRYCETGIYWKLVVKWSTYSLTLRSEILGVRALIKSCCTTT